MKFGTLLALVGMAASIAAAPARAQDNAAQQSEAVQRARITANEFFNADPKLREQTRNAPGYAVFTTFGISFLVGGAGGRGVVFNNRTGQNTYMNLAQASAGLQAGVADTRYLFIFNTVRDMERFINSGWEAGVGGGAGAGAGSRGNVGSGGGEFTGGRMFTLTRAGLQAGGAVAGTRVWRSGS
jgi:lipid-binding SYLF domain-containing protein